MRKFIILALILGVLGATAYGGRKVYRQWKTQRAVKQARQALARSDYNQAGLWLRQAISANANDVEAVQMMGNFAEVAQMPEAAVFWRNRLVELQPASLTNRLRLARAALTYGDYATAKKALDEIPVRDRNAAEVHKLTGALAAASGQLQEAENHFQQLVKLEPTNPIPQLNLAMLLAQRTNQTIAKQGSIMLETLCQNRTVRTDALRCLTLYELRQTNYSRASAVADELIRETNSTFQDRLTRLEVLRAGKSKILVTALAGCQQNAATNASEAFALSSWMLRTLEPRGALAWLQTLPPQIATNLPVTMSLADAYVATGDWVTLQRHVGSQHWSELDYLRLLYSSRALRQQNLEKASKAEWTKSLKGAEGRLDRLLSLERITLGWRWISELEEVLSVIVNKFPSEKRAIQRLSNLLFASGKTRSLLTLYAQEANHSPGNLAAKNNVASVALLLQAEEFNPHGLAQQVYTAQKDNAVFATTYAYSLHLQRRTVEALQVMQKLKTEDLERPAIAGYYGLLLAASGETSKARKYMDLANTARLLPEERQLFQRLKL